MLTNSEYVFGGLIFGFLMAGISWIIFKTCEPIVDDKYNEDSDE